MTDNKFISPLIPAQFPSFYREQNDGQALFVNFIKAYYEWLEQPGNVVFESRSLGDITDIDQTEQQFIKHFKHQYLSALPKSIISNPQLLVKHILDLYRSKGSKRSYELLFRILFNEDIELYIPSQFLLKSSDGTWEIPKYIETTSNPYMFNLIGKRIYNDDNSASAVVENFYEKVEQNRIINVLYLTAQQGRFKNGQIIKCDEVPQLANTQPILIIGSLSAIAIENGGYGFKVGDTLNIQGNGSGGKARVSSTRDENGKVVFTLINGGSGYSVNAIVSVTPTSSGGTGATFSVGGLTNKEIYYINTDYSNNYSSTQLDSDSLGVNINYNTPSGTGVFTQGAGVTSSANIVTLDCTYQTSSLIANGESLSNTTLGISGLFVYNSDISLVQCTGSDINLMNANIALGVILNSSVSLSRVIINTVWSKQTITGSGNISTNTNPNQITVTNMLGYFIPNNVIVDTTTGHTANVTSVVRNTDWGFQSPYVDNLDSIIGNSLTYVTLEVGSITYLKNINPGIGYSNNPMVTIEEPVIQVLQQSDGAGGIKGYNAVVNAIATNAPGIVTSADIVDSGFGYNAGETVYMSSSNALNQTVVTGISVIDLDGFGTGSWKDNKGFISDINKIQDNYFYQNYSYQIIAQRMFDTYEKFVKKIVHPAGIALFGKFQLKDELISEPSVDEGLVETQTTTNAIAQPIFTYDFTTSNNTLSPLMTFTRASNATYTNANGYLAVANSSVARFDYDPITLQPLGYLSEPGSTNLYINSNLFDATNGVGLKLQQVSWPKGPDNTNSTWLFQESGYSTLNNSHYLDDRFINVSNNTTYTMSMYIRAYENTLSQRTVMFRIVGATTSEIRQSFNPSTGTWIGSPASAQVQKLQNNWYRVSYNFVSNVANSSAVFRVHIAQSDGTTLNYNGDNKSGMYIFGGQVEPLENMTGYISTGATSVVRAGDLMTANLASLPIVNGITAQLNITNFQTAGVQFIGAPLSISPSSANPTYGIQNSTRILIYPSGLTSTLGKFVNNVGAANNFSSIVANASYKMAVSLDYNGAAGSINGVLKTVTNAGFPLNSDGSSNTSIIGILNNSWDGGNPVQARASKLVVWPYRLSNTDITMITT